LIVNDLRNAEGDGHGRPFASNLSQRDSRIAASLTGAVSAFMLENL
jgi:hypothetical protein